jgi:hypothetical protein
MSTQETQTAETQHLRCPRCGWEWEPMVLSPLECPRCKRRFNRDYQPTPFMKARQKHQLAKLLVAEPLSTLEQKSIMCAQCQEEDSMSSVYALFRIKGKPLCTKHAEAEAKQGE